MRVLLDTNVILDAEALGQVNCAVTTLSLATVFYVARKVVGTATARAAVRKSLAALTILPIDKQTLLDADAMTGNDFEDNIMIAAAVAASLDAIVTRNVADFAHSPIAVWEPAELLKRMAAGSSPPAAGAGPATGVP